MYRSATQRLMQRCDIPGIFARLLLVTGLLACCLPASVRAEQNLLDEHNVKAAFIYNFARFTTWPAHSDSAFKLCVIGEDPSAEALDTLAGKTVHDQTVEVIRIEAAAMSDDCELVYVGQSHDIHLDQLVPQLQGHPVLTISGIDGFIDHGGIIGFKIIDNKVRFEINVSAASMAGLSISSRLLSLASRVRMDR